MSKNTENYIAMYVAYKENEAAYWSWVESRKLFYQRLKSRFYYRKNVNREKRKAAAEEVLKDFPRASWRDVSSQTGGCKEIIWEFDLWETPHDPYWMDGYAIYTVFERLKQFPDEIYDAIEDTYEWSKKIHVRTTEIELCLPRILSDIGSGKVF